MRGTPGGSFDLADRAIGGGLADRLAEWRAEDPPATFDEIAHRLAQEPYKLQKSRETVRRWCNELAEVSA